MTPATQPEIRQRIRELASLVIGEREDSQLLQAVLVRNLTVEVNDFVKWHPAAFAKNRMRDHEILLRHPIARRTRKATA